MNIKKYSDYLVKWIQDSVNDAGAIGVVIGLSGGVDSSLVSALAKKAFPNNSLGVVMPINKMNNDWSDINKLKNNIKIKTKTIDLLDSFNIINNALKLRKKMSIANIKPRIRMIALYGIAHDNNYLVLGTDNKIEWEIGYFTKYGDGGADLLPINKLLKSEVIEMAKLLNVPQSIIDKPPSAGLWEGQYDEFELGFTYKDADAYFSGLSINKDTKNKIEKLHKKTKHKRILIPCPLAWNEN